MDHPIRVAYCPILFEANGGAHKANGLPILRQVDDDEDIVSRQGKCDTPYDCGVCHLLQEWIRPFVGKWSVGWECDRCLKETCKDDRLSVRERILPGFYQSGRVPDENPHPGLPGFDNTDVDHPPLEGCTRCGWQTSFLQLVLRYPP